MEAPGHVPIVPSPKSGTARVFLYNSELWTLTKKLENTVNTFQRRHLRKILVIHWPKKITNIELDTKPKTEEWSTTVQRRRINWLGHLMRLHPETPARSNMVWYGMVYLFFHRQYKVISKQIASEMSPYTVNERRPPYNPKVVLPQLLYR